MFQNLNVDPNFVAGTNLHNGSYIQTFVFASGRQQAGGRVQEESR